MAFNIFLCRGEFACRWLQPWKTTFFCFTGSGHRWSEPPETRPVCSQKHNVGIMLEKLEWTSRPVLPRCGLVSWSCAFAIGCDFRTPLILSFSQLLWRLSKVKTNARYSWEWVLICYFATPVLAGRWTYGPLGKVRLTKLCSGCLRDALIYLLISDFVQEREQMRDVFCFLFRWPLANKTVPLESTLSIKTVVFYSRCVDRDIHYNSWMC